MIKSTGNPGGGVNFKNIDILNIGVQFFSDETKTYSINKIYILNEVSHFYSYFIHLEIFIQDVYTIIQFSIIQYD